MSTSKKILQTYWQHAWAYPRYVIMLLVLMPTTLLLGSFLPPIIGARVLDKLSSGDFDSNNIWASFGSDLLLYALMVITAGMFLWRITIFAIFKLESYVLRDLYRTQFDHLISLSAQFHADSFGGSLVSQTNKFAGSYIRMQDTIFFQLYKLILAIVFASVIMWSRSPVYVLGLLFFCALFIVFSVTLGKPIRKLNAAEARAMNKNTGVLADAITNIMAVKSFSAQKEERQRFAESTEEVRHRTLDIMRASIIRDFAISSISSPVRVLALVIAIVSVVNYNMDIGIVFLILSYTTIITEQLWEFGLNTIRNINRSLGDARDGILMLETAAGVKDPEQPQKIAVKDGSVQFENVSFAHNGNENDALFENLSITIAAGEKVGLVGHSGSGKTSLTKLLLRYNDIDSGKISIDGQDISKITQEDLRRKIAYVPQEPLLFHRSIAENISYGEGDASMKRIIAAAKRANAHEFIEKLPNGYETLVGERGIKLSGGQRQRVAIARAFIKSAPLLVLDEATSALDSESEQLIQEALWNLMDNKTALVIAHRLSTIQKMDRILVMEDGKIIEDGSHAQLLKKKGKYASLWAHQSGGFISD